METVTSADGTDIAYDRGGDGPPVVLVHGTTGDHTAWDPVRPALEAEFTVYAMDRRGRGGSGDADDYAIEREFEDLVAVCASIDGPVGIVGHSYGALVAIGAAPQLETLGRLVLYEPPLFTANRGPVDGAVIDRMHDLLEAGEPEAVLETFFLDVAHSEERLERYRSRDDWSARVATAPTIPRENRSTGRYRPDPADYADLEVPTLVLLGGETGDPMRGSTEAAADLFPASDLVVLAGAGHAAVYTTPEAFVETVVGFLAEG